MQDAVSTRKIPAFPPISVPSCWTVKKTSVQACGISTSLPNDQGIFPGAFPDCFVMLHDEGKRNPGRTLMRPLMTRTDPLPCPAAVRPPASITSPRRSAKYKIRRAEEIMPDSCRAPSLHGRKTEKKRRPGFSINKQGTPAIMLFPAAEPIPSLKHAPGRQPGPGKVSGFPRRGKTGRPYGFPSPLSSRGNLKSWRKGNVLGLPHSSRQCYSATCGFPRLAQFHPGNRSSICSVMDEKRLAGVVLPLFSLRRNNDHGIGDLTALRPVD